MSGCIPLIGARRPEDPFVWRDDGPVTAGEFVARAAAFARALPPGTACINLCEDRYEFALAFAASLIAGKTNLLPPSRAFGVVRDLAAQYPGSCVIAGSGCEFVDARTIAFADLARGPASALDAMPEIPARHPAAVVFTSGSTGMPSAHRKTWGALIGTGHELALRFGFVPGPDEAIVGTVPPQHMYGLETTILLPFATGALLHGARPFFPADVDRALAALTGRRWLMTTPTHLRALMAEGMNRPPVESIVSATMPLAPALAAEIERRWNVPVLEIYGCTEGGSLATRQLTRDRAWVPIGDITIAPAAAGPAVQGGHLDEPVLLADDIDVIAPTRFELRGRAANLVKIGGKRASIESLDAALAGIPGVEDGVFVQRDADDRGGEARLIAFAVAPSLTVPDIMGALRERIDPVFLPRPLHLVTALPRNDLGKISRASLEALAADSGRTTHVG